MPHTVELECSPEELRQMTGRIRAYWEKIGNDNAFWSVLTNDKYLKENLDDSIDEFYASGSSIANQALSHIDEAGNSRGLELGCGTGRVSLHLADKLKELVACDISLPHLTLAKQHMEERSTGNIQFRNILEPDALLELGPVDFIFSVITLQHNPPPVIGQYIRNFCRMLDTGGTAFFQIPTVIDGYSFSVDDYLANDDFVMEMHMFPGKAVLDIAADSGCSVLAQFEQDMVGSKTVKSEVFVLRKN